MKKKDKKKWKRSVMRIGFGALALAMTLFGVIPLIMGRQFYRNWRGEWVLAPLALFIGAFFLFLVIFKWEKFVDYK
jgi:hypothetical protein